MDIHKWLEETAGAGTPHSPAQTPGAAFFHRPEEPRPVFTKKRTAKRRRSDSSLLDPQPHRRRTPPTESKPPLERSPVPSAASEPSDLSQSDSAESESSGLLYARKPRRKTRPERYEPKPIKKQRKHVHRSRKDESKKTRRRKKRKRGEQSGSGIAEGFHAKNVSRDRLTLKPRDQLGIFNKGRTSSAVRGRGLPDLVFSEMKFLQREKEQPEPVTQHAVSKKKRKKDHTHAREGEISAFFTSARPILAEKDGNATGRTPQKDGDAAIVTNRHERDRSTKSSGVVPTIEGLDKGSYLGFGSRGPQHESTSYLSWSESVRGPDAAPKHSGQVRDAENDNHSITKHHVASSPAGGEDTVFKRPAPRLAEHRNTVSSGHFRGSSVIGSGSHQRTSRSCSMPQQISSPQKLNLVDRAAKTRMTDSIQSPSSMPPSLPVRVNREDHRDPLNTDRRPDTSTQPRLSTRNHTPLRRHTIANQQHDARGIEPQTSSDLEGVIEQCHNTFDDRRRMSGQWRRHTVLPEPSFEQDQAVNPNGLRSNVQRHVRFSGLDRPSPIVPNFRGIGVYEQQAQRQTMPLVSPRHIDEGVVYSPPEGADYQDGRSVLYGEAGWEEYPEEQAAFEVDSGLIDYGVEDDLAAGHQVQHLVSDNSVVAPGFWRPNRLY